MVAARNELRIHLYETVTAIQQSGSTFCISTEDRFQTRREYQSAKVIIATGYFDHPNRLQIPGEELPKVFSYYKEAHPFAGMKVAIIGGNNSAVDAALDLERAGAEVTVICRRAELSDRVKAWTRPIFESMMNKGRIRVLFSSSVMEIHERYIKVNAAGETITLENDFVFALIGYRPDRTMLHSLGVRTDDKSGAPLYCPETMETNVPGVYIAGVIAAGADANAIFIENGRFHGKLIAEHIRKSMDKGA
jgi:thioredoxin reductase (NADPH)